MYIVYCAMWSKWRNENFTIISNRFMCVCMLSIKCFAPLAH